MRIAFNSKFMSSSYSFTAAKILKKIIEFEKYYYFTDSFFGR